MRLTSAYGTPEQSHKQVNIQHISLPRLSTLCMQFEKICLYRKQDDTRNYIVLIPLEINPLEAGNVSLFDRY